MTDSKSKYNILILNIDASDEHLPFRMIFNCVEGEEVTDLRDGKEQDISEYFEDEYLQLEAVKFANYDKNNERLELFFYQFISNHDSVSLLNFFSSNYSDFCINKTKEDLNFICKSVCGLFKRLEDQKYERIISKNDQLEIFNENLSKLCKYYQWQLFEEQNLRRSDEIDDPTPMISQVIFLDCTLRKDNRNLIQLDFNEVSFVYPEVLNHPTYKGIIIPYNCLEQIQRCFMSSNLFSNVKLANSSFFDDLISVPDTAYLTSPETSDKIKIVFDYHFYGEDSLLISAYFIDSRIYDSSLLDSRELPQIRRNISSYLETDSDLENVIVNSAFRNWYKVLRVRTEDIEKDHCLDRIIEDKKVDNL